jgi:signal transduction histidine kinase
MIPFVIWRVKTILILSTNRLALFLGVCMWQRDRFLRLAVAEGPIPASRCGQGQECDECILFNSIQESIKSDRSVHKKELQLTLDINGKRVQRVLSVSTEPVIIDSARYAVVAINDVTDRAKAEKALRETMEIKTQFISTVSHELRTPLASMKEAVLIVLEGIAGPTNPDQNKFLGLAKRNIDRLWRLINDVLDFQKLDANKMEFIMGKGALGEIVEEAYDTMLFFANQRKVGLSLDVDPKLPHTVFDRDRMIQVLTNLMSNAIKFTPAEGQRTIRLRHMNDELILSVIDEGMGIPPEAMDRIFDRFYRVSRPGQTIKGTGLGLAIVQQIIQAHGGRIEVESEVNKGTTFVTYLPVNPVKTGEELSKETDIVLENLDINSSSVY